MTVPPPLPTHPDADDRQDTAVLRLACGLETAWHDGHGRRWEAGADPSGHCWIRTGGALAARDPDLPLHPAWLAPVLRRECHGLESCLLPLPPGRYRVRLLVAETHQALAVLERRFTVSHGDWTSPPITPAQLAGGFARAAWIDLSGLVAEADGLRLRFSAGAALYAIEVHRDAADREPAMAHQALAPAGIPPEPPAAPQAQHRRLLFVGHSGVFYWAIPQTLARMVAMHHDHLRLETDQLCFGGKDIAHLAAHPAVATRIATGGCDAVALTDSSAGPLERPEPFAAHLPDLIGRVRAAGAVPLLYAYSAPARHTPDDRLRIQEAYDRIGAEHGAAVVPWAATLALAERRWPDRCWQDPDRHHLGYCAGYMNACLWYRALTGASAAAPR